MIRPIVTALLGLALCLAAATFDSPSLYVPGVGLLVLAPQLDIAYPACCVKRRAPIDTTGGFVETEAEHEVRRLPATIENGVRQT